MAAFDPFLPLRVDVKLRSMARRSNWKKDLGWGLIVTTTILMCLPIWAALNNPATLIHDWEFFLPLVILPYLVGVALLIVGRRAV